MDPLRNPEERPTGRALVPLAPAERAAAAEPGQRPSATFLAHLIAAERQLPQARARRRVEPREAVAAYCAPQARRRGRIVCSS